MCGCEGFAVVSASPKGTPAGTRPPVLVFTLLFHDSAKHGPFNTHGLRMLKWQLYNRWM